MPVHFDIYPGNIFEWQTFKNAIEKMKSRYNLGKVIILSDKGMMSRNNIEVVENSGYEYIIGKSIKQIQKVDIFDGEFEEITKGIKLQRNRI